MENDALLKQILSLMEKLQNENSALKQQIVELSEKKQSPVCLTQMKDVPIGINDYLMNLTRRQQSELSTSKEAALQNKIRKTVDNLLEYSKVVQFT